MSANNRREIPWLLVLIMMVFAFPVGMILLFLKLFSGSSSYRGYNTSRTYQPPRQGQRPNYGYRGDAQHSGTYGQTGDAQGRSYQPASQAQQAKYQAAPDMAVPGPKTARPGQYAYDYRPGGTTRTLPPRLQRKLTKNGGKGLQITGLIILICAALSSVMTLAGNISAYNGFFESAFYATIVAISVGVPGAVFTIIGNNLRGRGFRCQQYYTMIGSRRTVDIRELAAAIPVSYSKACRDLQWMITEGFFPGAYIDASRRCLTYSFATAEPEHKETPKPKAEEKPKSEETKPKTPGVFKEVLRIRELNNEIGDPFVSERMFRLEELTQKIFTYIEENPAKEDRVRQFKDHYLPKTIKILESYSRFEKQGVNGANIRAAMKDVEEIMDTLVNGFEKQLDMLFDDEALDVTTDINVLESMMGLQGLRSDDPFRLELMGGEN